MTNPKEVLEWYERKRELENSKKKNIEEIERKITEAFQEWDPLSDKLTGLGLNHDKEWPDFPVIGIYVLSLVNKAFEAGMEKGYKRGCEFHIATGSVTEQWHDGYEHGFNDAAKDPKAWYLLDKNGEKAHIRDTVKDKNGEYEIKALGINIIFEHYEHKAKLISECEKVTPDTREKIKDDLSELLAEFYDEAIEREDVPIISRLWPNGNSANDVAEQFISRIEALEE